MKDLETWRGRHPPTESREMWRQPPSTITSLSRHTVFNLGFRILSTGHCRFENFNPTSPPRKLSPLDADHPRGKLNSH